MADFLVWLSEQPPPRRLRHHWYWPGDGPLAVRPTTATRVGSAVADAGQLVCIGDCHGRRSRRSRISANELASDLLDELPRRGTDALNARLGSFAGAFADADGHLVVWRDRFGRIPVQMIRLSDGWAVTSCPTTAAALSTQRPRWSLLTDFMTGRPTTTDADVFDDLYRLRPAEAVRFSGHSIQRRHHWWNPSPRPVDDPDHRLRTILTDIGRTYGSSPHLLGLSAGIDSAVLAAFATARHPASCAITFSDSGCEHDETADARATAQFLNIPWHRFDISDHGPLTRRDDHRFPLAWGPPAHPDFAWKMPLHRQLRHRFGSRPIVYGNGADDALWIPADMWFDGRFQNLDATALARAVPHVSVTQLVRPALRAALQRFGSRPLRSLLPSWPDHRPLWCTPDHWLDVPARPPRPLPGDTPEQKLYHLRIRRLRGWRWERITRSLAVESRRADRLILTPFLDAEFWELTLSLNARHLVEGGRQKAILRRAAGDLLPRGCVHRPKVGGFDPVVERGLAERATQQVYRLMAASQLADTWRGFDPVRFADAYEAYRRCRPDSGCRGSWAIWKTVAAELWIRRRNANDAVARSTTAREVRP